MKDSTGFNKYIIDKELSITKAMEIIEQNGGISLLICNNGILTGCISDGDIRRFLMKTGNVKGRVWEAANLTPFFVETESEIKSSIDISKAKSLIETYGIDIVPIVNKNCEVVDLVFAKNIKTTKKEQLGIPVVIMAGGKGTRLAPYTQILPKPLIPIGDRTIIEHIMDRFEEYGCKHFDLILNYKKNFIKAFFTDEENQRDIEFVEEGKFLGTAGGLGLISGKYTEDIFVSNCDILIEADYSDIVKKHREDNNLITVVCAHKRNVIPYGTVHTDESGQIIEFKEKPVFEFLTNTGMYLVNARFLEKIPEDTFIHITDVIEKCILEGERVGTYCVEEDAWMDMGQFEELERMRTRLE